MVDFRAIPEGRLIEQLLSRELVTEEVLVQALQEQRRLIEQGIDVHLGEVLLRGGKISESDLTSTTGDQPATG